MKKKNNILIFLGLFLLPLGFAAADSLTFSGDNMQSVFAQGKEKTIISGNAVVKTDTMDITAERIEIYGDNSRYVNCTGNIVVIDQAQGFIIRSENLFYDRDLGISRINGNTVMEDRENDIIVKGSFLEHNENENRTIIQIGVRILQENMVSRSEFANYLRDEDLLELTGMPIVYKDDDIFQAAKIIINLETEEITMVGQVSGSVVSEDKPEEEPLTTEMETTVIESSNQENSGNIVSEDNNENDQLAEQE